MNSIAVTVAVGTFTRIVLASLLTCSIGTGSTANSKTSGGDTRTTTLHFVEAKPAGRFVQGVSRAFATAHFVRIKYASAGTAEGSVDQNTIRKKWEFSVTQNCDGPCSKTISAIGKIIMSARRVDGRCSLPYETLVEFLDAKEKIIDSFAFGIGGGCFSYRGEFFGIGVNKPIGESLSSFPFVEIFRLE
jgi:hypothetical protein